VAAGLKFPFSRHIYLITNSGGGGAVINRMGLHVMNKLRFVRLAFAPAMLGLFLGSANNAFACDAEGLVTGIATSFEHAASSHSPGAFSSAVGHYADMRGLALFALGPYRSKLQRENEAQYVNSARGFLGRWMAENSDKISGSGITIQSCSEQVVSARFGNGTSVVFRLAGPRRVSDVSVSGISLSGVLRDKFTGVIRDHGGDMQALLDYLDQ
jgi:MlaC protein